MIVGLLGGRVAEALFVGDISVGASNDIDRVTKIAKDMVARKSGNIMNISSMNAYYSYFYYYGRSCGVSCEGGF